MAIALTEKIRAKLSGGTEFSLYDVTGLSAGANNITATSIGLHQITVAEFRPAVATTSAGATTVSSLMTAYSGTQVTITCLDAGDAGTIRAYGY